MTNLRRHLLLVVAVCVALAAGIALGGGPLQGESEDRTGDLTAERDALRDELAAVQDERILDQALLDAASTGLVGSRLDGRTVTVLQLPGTDAEAVTGLLEAVREAGGSVAVNAHLSPQLLDPAQKTYVDSVATNSVSGEPALEEAVTGETYDRIGALIARAYVGTAEDSALDETATLIDSELQGAELVEVEGEPGRTGSLVVLVGPLAEEDPATLEAHNVILTAISRALVRRGDAFLLARPTGGNPEASLASALGTDPTLVEDTTWSVLNVVEGAAAQVTAVYALSAALAGEGGVFGVQSGVAELPPGLPTPTD
jgi:hypothetical protein